MTGSYTEPDEFQPNLSFIVLYPPVHEGLARRYLTRVVKCMPSRTVSFSPAAGNYEKRFLYSDIFGERQKSIDL